MSERIKIKFEPKPLFLERMKKLLPEEKDFNDWLEISKTSPQNSIRCNTIKISPEKLKKSLEKEYNWKISQPWKKFPEIMIIEGKIESNPNLPNSEINGVNNNLEQNTIDDQLNKDNNIN